MGYNRENYRRIREEYRTKYLKAREAADAGMLYLLLTGGEPFLYPQFRVLMEGLHSMGLLITINSNGTMIDASVVEWLKQCPPSRINISLYGASDETYAQLCVHR